MSADFIPFLWAALFLGVLHTVVGPDHYLPLIAIARARGWSRTQAFWATLLCGLGHIGGALLLGLLGTTGLLSLHKLQFIETFRGDVAAQAFILFGLMYFIWGMKKAFRKEDNAANFLKQRNMHPGFWLLLLIFVVGPCEPLIPLIMYPTVAHSVKAVMLVTLVFGAATIFTMFMMVQTLAFGVALPRRVFPARFAHAFAGVVIMACGLGMKYLGL